jgi:hypothetical protein
MQHLSRKGRIAMDEIKELAPNVQSFLDIASDQYGKIKAAEFNQIMYSLLTEREITSPIEHLFFIACYVLCAAHQREINPDPHITDNGKFDYPPCFFVEPQVVIGSYRVDFVITENIKPSPYRKTPAPIHAPVIVELDGHAFHDKNKEQRAREKARDRFLIKTGYKILHFTGSEVNADPFKVAFEAFSLTGLFYEDEEYDPENPLGVE